MRWAVPIPDLAASVLVEQKVTATYTKNKSIRIAFRKGKKNKKKKKRTSIPCRLQPGHAAAVAGEHAGGADLVEPEPSRGLARHDAHPKGATT